MNKFLASLRMARRSLWVVLLAGLVGSGCGGGKGEVSGTVTYQGKPVTIGTVTFLDANTNQALASSAIIRGKYAMAKVPAGLVKVLVTVPPPPPPGGERIRLSLKKVKEEQKKKATLKDSAPPPDESGGQPVPQFTIPAKYGSPDQSGLTYTVRPGAQQHDIELE
jgi:hypothetical protein